MKRFLSLSMCLCLMVSLTGLAVAKDNAVRDYSDVHFAIEGPNTVLTSSSSDARFKATAGTDTFCLFGGPGSDDGKFSDSTGVVPLSIAQLDAAGWVFVDVTDQPTLWQLSTFNMDNLNSNGAGNQGMWAGQSAAQQPGWTSAPGYGNSWNALLEFSAPMVDPSVGQTVGLDFYFNHDSEPGYDFFNVQYDSAGSAVVVYSRDSSNKDGSNIFQAPGVQYSTQGSAQPIVYAGNDYASGNSEIVIQMTATSDGAWSDEDGLWSTDAGLAQVDDITVTYNDGAPKAAQVVFEDFEGAGPYAWVPEKAPFAGYFGKVFGAATDNDPCRENITPTFGFMDDGTGPFNASYSGTGTGGTTSINWSYGVAGGWVVNYNGGISLGTLDLDNEIYSPEIDWDLPGTEDDGAQVAGAFIRTSIWRHLPLGNGMFYQWSVRARDSVTGIWTAWANRNFVYYGGGTGDWLNIQPDVSDLVVAPNGRDAVQMQLAVRDLAIVFAFAGTDATPSPYFDNMAFLKYKVGGPSFATRNIDLFNDSFTQTGNTDASTQAARDAMDVRIDMARGVSTGNELIAGDSIIVDVTSVIPGNTVDVADIKMKWVLHKNPYFEDAIRGNAVGTVAAGAGINGWDTVSGEVVGQQSTTSAGAPVENRFFFDAPDSDFMYPGDMFQYYIEATDSGALTTTLPANIAGFGDSDKSTYSRTFTVRALPSIGASGQPSLLLVNDFGRRGGENDYLSAFGQLGYEEGVDYDTYTVQGPTSGIDNGIGSTGGVGRGHGATGGQLAGYSCIMYVAGNLGTFLLSDGTDTGQNDKGDDLGTMTAWHNQAADRYAVYFADGIATALASTGTGTGSTAGDTYRTSIMGVAYNDNDVRDEIGGITAPLVTPTGAVGAFAEDFAVFGGCLLINQFDSIDVSGGGSVVSHEFNPGPGGAARTAGIVWDRLDSGFRKVDITFPYGFVYVWDAGAPNAGGVSDRTVLLSEILGIFGGHAGTGPVVGADNAAQPKLVLDANYPNPFNPKTEIRFALGVKGPVTVKIYNVAGRVVRTLANNEVFEAGQNSLTWNGVDQSGASVASGLYIAKVDANGYTDHVKMALVK